MQINIGTKCTPGSAGSQLEGKATIRTNEKNKNIIQEQTNAETTKPIRLE